MFDDHDPIAAPATAAGGALVVIRVSGQNALGICDRIFRGRTSLTDAPGNTVWYGRILDGDRTIDDVLISVFRAPHSYTGEDSAEISCHGSRYIVSEILRLLIGAGARMAQPGEFTTRAFLAGKMDLAQAEAVADLIASSSRAAHAVASTQMRGGFSSALSVLRTRLLNLTSLLELELDFSEEEVEFADRTELRRTMQEISTQIESLQSSFSLGNALKRGVPVAIVGAPNVGKSTLLNQLLGEDRAMVSEIAGTTRDAIEATTDIDGVIFRFIDTAGIHTTDDRLEQMGIERTLAAAEKAKIIVHLTDATHLPPSPTTSQNEQSNTPATAPQEDNQATTRLIPTLNNTSTLHIRPEQRMIKVVNKMDLADRLPLPADMIGISARTGIGIDILRHALREGIDTENIYQGDAVISSARHYAALTAAQNALHSALTSLDEARTSDLLSEDIRTVLHHLGTITGEITNDEILGNIFSKFCIGK